MYSWKTVVITIGLLFGLKIWNPISQKIYHGLILIIYTISGSSSGR